MKTKILTLLLITASFAISFGQKPHQERQTEFFVKAFARKYKLNKKEQKKLTEARNVMVVGFRETQLKVKNHEITGRDKQERNRQVSREFNKILSKITGKTYKEMQPFIQKVRKKMKKIE